ncbi:MAG: O-antigen ligase family protein [Oscillospiraceae bacterium]|nr:O-antigen ligase family protein [Oscillospiraceae bacterium]
MKTEKKTDGLIGSGLLLTLLFALQPCLDALAYWTRNDRVTPAGLIRLGIMVLLPIVVFLMTDRKKAFFGFLAAVGLFCLLHALNCLRVGYIRPVYDIRYMASVVQMPLFAVCFLLCIREERTKEAAYRGVAIAAALTLIFLVIARLTKTGNVTYGEGLGYSGWVIDENRNANSTNLVIFACFCVFLALRTEKHWILAAAAVAVDAVFLMNGTKGCYFSIFAIFLSFALFFVLERRLSKKDLNRFALILLVGLSIFSALIYPWTPRYKVTEEQRKTARGTQGEIEATLLEKGIDITHMSAEERFENPEVKEVFVFYYWKYLGVKPDLIDRFGMDRVLMQYRMSTNVAKLIDARIMERNYADMVFQDADPLTRVVGFEASEMGFDGIYDLENDWHAVFYYYGYLGFLLYIGFVAYFLLRIIRCVRKDLPGCFSLENVSLLLVLILVLGLAHFSGATLRRPNVSIWLSLILALIYYVTEVSSHAAFDHHPGLECGKDS